MPRANRRIEAEVIYHVLNRGNGRRNLFSKPADFAAFIKLLGEALPRFEIDLLAWCLMGNHWHLLLRPRKANVLSRMMAWVTVTHARRHHMHYPNPGSGHLYQGRFKSFPVESDEHLLTVARYIHANPLRAGLVKRAELWPWSDLGTATAELPVTDWPVERPRNWTGLVNKSMDPSQAAAVAESIRRGSPYGSAEWTRKTAAKQGLQNTLHPRGRPRLPLDSLSPRYRKAVERMHAKAEKSR